MRGNDEFPSKFFFFKVFLEEVGKLQFNERLGDMRKPVQSSIDMVKLLRVYGGCLGVERRRRTWLTAISPGQVSSNR